MKRIICLLACISIGLTGCSSVTLTAKESDMIAEYAAYVVLKHDISYNSKLQDEVLETEPETTTSTETASGSQQGGGGQTEESTAAQPELTLTEALGLGSGFQAECTGYEVSDLYEDEYFRFPATTNKTLLVLHFNIKNTTQEEKECNILVNQLAFRCQINGEGKVGAQLTMLLNDLYSFKEMMAPEEVKEAVLIFQISDSYENNMESIDFIVKNNGVSYTYPIEFK